MRGAREAVTVSIYKTLDTMLPSTLDARRKHAWGDTAAIKTNRSRAPPPRRRSPPSRPPSQAIIRQRGRWCSDVASVYQRALAEEHLRGSAAVGEANGAELEALCSGWSQPATFR